MFSWGKPSKDMFASQLCEAIAKVDQQRQYRYDAENFRLIREGGDGEVNLSNMYQEHCALPADQRKANLQRLASIFVSTVEELPVSYEEAKSHLRPKIYNRSTFEFMALKQQIEGGKTLDLPLYPLGNHLYSSLVYDTENAMRSVSNDELTEWGTTYYEALEVACAHLDETTMVLTKIGDGFHSSISGDNYDSSRILLVGTTRTFDVIGDPVATVPHRDVLYLAGSGDDVSLKILFDLTAKATEEESRPLCPLPLRLVDGVWEDWIPPKNHVLRGPYDEMELRFLGGLYAQQQELLNALFRKRDVDIFVTSFSAVQRKDSEKLFSYCVWARNVDALLPRTQFVVFIDEAGVVASGEWDHVADVVEDLLVADDSYYPIRYRATNFPSAEQLASIGKSPPFAE